MGYVDEVLDIVSKKNADQPEFLQAVTEVLESLRPVVEANEEVYRKNAILERITDHKIPEFVQNQVRLYLRWAMQTHSVFLHPLEHESFFSKHK